MMEDKKENTRIPNSSTSRHHMKRHAPSSCLLKPSNASSRVEVSKKFTRAELEEACRRFKTKDIAAMAATRKRDARAVQNQRAAQHGTDSIDTSGQLRSLDAGVKLCARKFNEAKAQADKLDDEVKARCDELIELQREAMALHEMLEGNNSEARKISELSAEIHEVSNCSERTLLYRHQLNHMHHRVRKNSVTMDSHIGEMSSTLSSALRERERCQKMLGEVESGLTLALRELEESTRDAGIADEERNRELAIKQSEASDAGKMEEWNNERLSSNIALHESLLGGADKLARERIQRGIRDRESQLTQLRKTMEEKAAKLSEFEASFTHVKQATGVNGLAEMVEKITKHEETHGQLLMEKKEAEERLIVAKTSLTKDQETLDRMKTNGFGDTELNREIIDDIKSSIASERSEGKIVKSTNSRLEALLVGLRQGGIGLYNRLLPFYTTLLHGDAPNLGDIDSTNAVRAASDTLEMINVTEKILGRMLIDIGGLATVNRFIHKDDPKSAVGKEIGSESPNQGMNCRIKPKDSSNKDAEGGNDNDVVARDDNVESCDDVPSRTILKMNSEMHTTEAQRLQQSKKKKKYFNEVRPQQTGDDSDEEGAPESTELYTNKQTTKVSSLTSPSTRSKAHSSREDPMDRVQAFLTEMPPLE